MTTLPFHHYKVPRTRSPLANRDLEFLWSDTYLWRFNRPLAAADPDVANDLDRLGAAVCDSLSNPFGFPFPDIELVVNYLGARYSFRDTLYDTNPNRIGFRVARPDYADAHRDHVDTYLSVRRLETDPTHPYYDPVYGSFPGDGEPYPSFPSGFEVVAEDSLQQPGVPPGSLQVFHRNSIHLHGPPPSGVGVTGSTAWTRPGALANAGFVHEFQHALNDESGSSFLHIFSTAAEALCGIAPDPPRWDVPFTWSLTRGANYAAWSSFSAYLAYNFRGTDLTSAGAWDDLLWRWAGQAAWEHTLAGLARRLDDSECRECGNRGYFQGLSPHDRLQLLIHNWRVANYVNNFALAGGQYGFDPQFNFSPDVVLGNWQDLSGGRGDNSIALPFDLTATEAWKTRQVTFTERPGTADYGPRPLTLEMFGAEYFVIHADPSLYGTGHNLVVRVAPEGIHREHEVIVPGPDECSLAVEVAKDARLMVSLVTYSGDSDELFRHPDLALGVSTQQADVDSLTGELMFLISNFGTTVKAVLAVVTLEDGPSGYYSNQFITSGQPLLPIRFAAALRTPPLAPLAPVALPADTQSVDDAPAWSPGGDEIAYARTPRTGGPTRIYRTAIGTPAPAPLFAGSENQSQPDWSPRGDWIAFAQDSGGTKRDIWLYHTTSGQTRRLTVQTGNAVSPAFSPDGQQVAYARTINLGLPDAVTGEVQPPAECVGCGWELRRVNLDGTSDVRLLTLAGAPAMRSLRWTPDGEWIYFRHRETQPGGFPGPDRLWAVSWDGSQALTRDGLADDAASFDFHRGSGPLLLEQSGSMTWPRTCNTWAQVFCGCVDEPQEMPFLRVALRDTVTGDTEPRFYRRGARLLHPRWSFDGTRVSYSSDQNLPDDRDVFVASASYNHAPQFHGLADVVVHPGEPFQMLLTATDPDGEALTHAVASRFLPPGASFDPATRLFSWPNPGPQGSEHFVVFWATDGSSGVASQVVRLTVTIGAVADLNPDLVSETQAWLTWTAPGQAGTPAVEYDLRYAPFAINEANFAIATRAWDAPAPGPPGTAEAYTVSGLNSCTQYWFALKAKDAGGNWSALSNVPTAVTLCGGGAGGGGEMRAGRAGPTVAGLAPGLAEPALARPGGLDSSRAGLAVQMGGSDGATIWSAYFLTAEEALALAGADSASIVLQGREGGGWHTRARLALAGSGWRFGLRALRRPGRLVFLGAYDLLQAWTAVEPAAFGSAAIVELAAARHSRLGDLTAAMEATGGYEGGLSPGDTLVLRYDPATEAAETAQPWFMVIGPPGSSGGVQGFRREAPRDPASQPDAFLLGQNHPNPAAGTTAIRFELPVAADVRLEVFDPQGRLVRTLAAGWFPAGAHAVVWDRRDAGGNRAGAGVYLYRIQAAAFRHRKKMVLLE